MVQAVGKLSYNQLVEKIITCKQASDSSLVSEGNGPPAAQAARSPGSPEGRGGASAPWPRSHPALAPGLVAEQFLESTASQLTYHGLCELTAAVREGELSVFFRNNHFSTMIKHKVRRSGPFPGFLRAGGPPPNAGRGQLSLLPSPQGHLYLLVTDQGFLQEERVVWESLHNVDGDSCFCDTDFHLSHAPGKEGAAAAPLDHQLPQRQVDQVGDNRWRWGDA